jgi:tRNA isopentenyl-2-thiomethyl-A-37 hydroxylase MiaE
MIMLSISSDKLEIETRLLAPDLPKGHGLYPVLAAALKSRPAPQFSVGRRMPRLVSLSDPVHSNINEHIEKEAPAERPFWPASYFNLDQVTVCRNSNEAEKRAILLGCSHSVLAEAYYIEKCGMYFASKMCLLSESAQERMLYSLFAADEAVHFNWISGFAHAESVKEVENSPFIRLLDEVLRKENRTTLSYIVQVILEGWGISHYHALAKSCLDDGLAAVFENVIRDEGRHHAGGLALFNELRPGADILKRLTDLLAQLLLMVQAGPQMVVSQIDRVKGRLSQAQKTRAFAELDCEGATSNKIKTLMSLIRTAAGADVILNELERKGSFRPYTASECAAAS